MIKPEDGLPVGLPKFGYVKLKHVDGGEIFRTGDHLRVRITKATQPGGAFLFTFKKEELLEDEICEGKEWDFQYQTLGIGTYGVYIEIFFTLRKESCS